MPSQKSSSYFLVQGEPLSINRVTRLTASQNKRLVAVAKKSGVKVGVYMRAVLDHAIDQEWKVEQRADIVERVVSTKQGGRDE